MQKIFRLRWSLLNVLTYDMFLRFCHSRVTIDHYSFFSGLQEPEHVHSNSGAYGRNAQRFLVDDMARKEPRDRHGNKPGRARQDKIREVLAWRPRHIRLRASFADRRGTHGRLRGPIVCPATGLSKSELKLREKLFCWSPPRVYWHSVNLELMFPAVEPLQAPWSAVFVVHVCVVGARQAIETKPSWRFRTTLPQLIVYCLWRHCGHHCLTLLNLFDLFISSIFCRLPLNALPASFCSAHEGFVKKMPSHVSCCSGGRIRRARRQAVSFHVVAGPRSACPPHGFAFVCAKSKSVWTSWWELVFDVTDQY